MLAVVLFVSLTCALGDATFGISPLNALSCDSCASESLLCSGHANEQVQQGNCIPLAFAVECTSDDIGFGNPVKCSIKSDAPEGAPFVLRWSVSRGAHKRLTPGKSVKVYLSDTGKAKVRVTVKVLSPKVCFNTASKDLRVINPRKRSDPNQYKH